MDVLPKVPSSATAVPNGVSRSYHDPAAEGTATRHNGTPDANEYRSRGAPSVYAVVGGTTVIAHLVLSALTIVLAFSALDDIFQNSANARFIWFGPSANNTFGTNPMERVGPPLCTIAIVDSSLSITVSIMFLFWLQERRKRWSSLELNDSWQAMCLSTSAVLAHLHLFFFGLAITTLSSDSLESGTVKTLAILSLCQIFCVVVLLNFAYYLRSPAIIRSRM